MLSSASMPMAVRVSIVAAPRCGSRNVFLIARYPGFSFGSPSYVSKPTAATWPQGSNQIFVDYHAASGGVHNNRAARQDRNCFCVEEVTGLLCFGCVYAQKWADSKQIIEVIVEYRASFNFTR
jgi:hypothetical protein